ncbi:hypothetical protein DLAC_04794 [Tieghemostelium lacteum]|uniref:Uncharacterized protein n=1 Tax=Tieghemostelium lacteum TaxID=361077 RepID=A0A151ZKG8_TIELA|nr:hypothetical protein DLAC_04794 [Tieghemostelium lacteum]|eukprot:KYQ94488.1 hypothetical protein DLAC_04794 [Tieghemostelium lacteum]
MNSKKSLKQKLLSARSNLPKKQAVPQNNVVNNDEHIPQSNVQKDEDKITIRNSIPIESQQLEILDDVLMHIDKLNNNSNIDTTNSNDTVIVNNNISDNGLSECPICMKSIPNSEIESHVMIELEQMESTEPKKEFNVNSLKQRLPIKSNSNNNNNNNSIIKNLSVKRKLDFQIDQDIFKNDDIIYSDDEIKPYKKATTTTTTTTSRNSINARDLINLKNSKPSSKSNNNNNSIILEEDFISSNSTDSSYVPIDDDPDEIEFTQYHRNSKNNNNILEEEDDDIIDLEGDDEKSNPFAIKNQSKVPSDLSNICKPKYSGAKLAVPPPKFNSFSKQPTSPSTKPYSSYSKKSSSTLSPSQKSPKPFKKWKRKSYKSSSSPLKKDKKTKIPKVKVKPEK